MSELVHDVLSIWEIAHRWHDHDPNITDPEKLPLEVQDTLRFLTRRMAYHDLHSCSIRGVENWTEEAIMSEHEYIKRDEDEDPYDPDEYSYEDYYQNVSRRVDTHRKIVEDFDRCYEGRIYNKKILDNTFTLKHRLPKLCDWYEMELPKFWFPDGIDHDNPEADKEEEKDGKQLRPNQIHRQLCQVVAQTLWDIYPSMTIVDMMRHKAIREYGGGGYYSPEKTLRKWLSEVDPRTKEQKTGRPKSK